ncbi:hypothetical protein [Paracoccus versutus]
MAEHVRLEVDNTGTAPHPQKRKEGGEPPGGNMEPRIAKLEAQMDAARDDLRSLKAACESLKDSASDLKTAIARIDAKMDSKIDYKWMTIYVLGIVAVIMREEIIGWFK